MKSEFPILYAITSKGDIKQWTVSAILDNDKALLRKVYGKYEGKMQINDKEIKGKNIGRSNETTPFEQACFDAESAFKKKKDNNYVEHVPNNTEASTYVLPMLAHSFFKRGHNIIYRAYVQPKLNGVRCLATKVSKTEIDFRSRKGKSYNEVCQHLKGTLLDMMIVGDIYDGELYNHSWTFQQIARHSKKVREGQNNLEFWVYDLAINKHHFTERLTYLKYQTSKHSPVKLVDT